MVSRTYQSPIAHWWWTVDRWSLAAIATLIIAGVMLTLAASPAVAGRIGLEPFHFVYRQLSFVAPAFLMIFIVSLLGPREVRRLALVVFAGALALMVATLFLGPEIKGAHRWLIFGPFSLQPSEFVKPAFVVLAAAALAESNRSPGFPGMLIAMALFAAVAGVLVLQPDFGQTLLLSVVCAALLFLAGLRWQWLAAFGGLAVAGGVGSYVFVPHVASRIDRFMSPDQGDSFQVNTALNAFVNGGITGVGPGEGTVKFVLPDAHADFIFAVAGEEFGAGGVYGADCAVWRGGLAGVEAGFGRKRSFYPVGGGRPCRDVRLAGGDQHRGQFEPAAGQGYDLAVCLVWRIVDAGAGAFGGHAAGTDT